MGGRNPLTCTVISPTQNCAGRELESEGRTQVSMQGQAFTRLGVVWPELVGAASAQPQLCSLDSKVPACVMLGTPTPP